MFKDKELRNIVVGIKGYWTRKPLPGGESWFIQPVDGLVQRVFKLEKENEKLKAVVAEICDAHYELKDKFDELQSAYALTICDVLKLQKRRKK